RCVALPAEGRQAEGAQTAADGRVDAVDPPQGRCARSAAQRAAVGPGAASAGPDPAESDREEGREEVRGALVHVAGREEERAAETDNPQGGPPGTCGRRPPPGGNDGAAPPPPAGPGDASAGPPLGPPRDRQEG